MLADMNTKSEDALSAIFKQHGAFFAFSSKQFDEAKVEGVKYISLGAGLISPKENAIQLEKDIIANGDKRVKDDLANNSRKDIIWRELANHEAQITHDTDSTFDALEGYGITRQEIDDQFADYFSHCVEHNYF